MNTTDTAVANLVVFEVPAGTAIGAAMRELDLPNKGPEAIVCAKDAEAN